MRPLDERGSRDYIASLLHDEEQSVARENGKKLSGPGEVAEPKPPVTTGAAAVDAKTTDGAAVTPVPGSASGVAPTPEVVTPADTRRDAQSGTRRACVQQKRVVPGTGSSPRRVLRFVNVYRALRATLRPDDIETLRQGGYRALLAQVAIGTGAPLLLDAWFEVLAELPRDASPSTTSSRR